jgi:hypothetical protein
MSPSDSSDQAPAASSEDPSDADASSDTTSNDSSDQASDSSIRADEQPARPIAYSSETTVVTSPQRDTVVVTPADEPRYVPETGDAQYGSKLAPENRLAPGEVAPPARFNDATGQ